MREQCLCPNCKEEGKLRKRMDAYADFIVYNDSTLELDDIVVMDGDPIYECFNCGEQFSFYKLKQIYPYLKEYE